MTEPSLFDKLPIIGTVRRRLRLEVAPEKAITTGAGGTLYRYQDPLTGIVYVGKSRWDPTLTPSVLNEASRPFDDGGEG